MASRVIAEKQRLAECLSIVSRAVMPRATLQVLSSILLRGEDGVLRLSATDLSVGITARMEANIEGSFNLTLPARTLTDVVSALSDPEVRLSMNGKPEAELNSGSYNGKIKGIDASEYPPVEDYDGASGVTFKADDLRQMIQSVVFATSNSENRPILTGVLLLLEGNKITLAATDGFRLALKKATLDTRVEQPRRLVIPADSLKETVRILNTNRESQAALAVPSAERVVLRCENVQLVSQILDGSFPDYQSIIPRSFKSRITMPADELLRACKQAAIIARESTNVALLHIQPGGTEYAGKVTVKATSDSTGTSEITLDAVVEGPELSIAFNVKYLQDGLEAVATPQVLIEANAPNTPAVIKPASGEDYLYLLMPMHYEK